MRHIPTASQTVGPFFNFALTSDRKLGVVAGPDCAGERIRLTVRVIDGEGAGCCGDVMIELWQPGAIPGFGRLETGIDGSCTFETIRPAPHIDVLVFARGMLRHLHTRVYFEGDPANGEDLVLGLVPEERRATLLAKRSAGDPAAWNFDIVLQGDGETVFFDV